jgi:fermentation-respiration switch protein FrsA (DUF1100 family)
MNTRLKRILVGEFTLRRMIWSLITVPIFIYLGLGITLYFFSERLIFAAHKSSYSDDDEIIKIETYDGKRLSALFFPSPTANQTIILFHGNAEDIGELKYFCKVLSKNGFSMLVFDYRGYGTSEGVSTEENAYRDAQSVFDYAKNSLRIPPEQIILLGHSLGGAIAIDLASKQHCGGLIVESSFVSASRVVTGARIFPFEKFRSLEKIEKVIVPVLVIHGINDEVIAFWHGKTLFEYANEPKSSYWVEGAHHNDLSFVAGDEYLVKLRQFAESLNLK